MVKRLAWRNGWLMSVIAILLISCGFHLRAPELISFKTVQVSGNTMITKPLIKQLKLQAIEIVTEPQAAELRVELLKEESEKRILSLSGTGVVREYELYYRVQYRTKTTQEATWSVPLQIESRRDFTFDDGSALAKQLEDKRLVETMQTEVMSGILRRLSALKNSP